MLDNPKANKIKQIAKLRHSKHRRETGRFIVEGRHAVRELLVHAPELTLEVFIREDLTPLAEHNPGNTPTEEKTLLELAIQKNVEVTIASRQVLAKIADTVHPQGVIATAKQHTTPINEALTNAKLVAVMHQVSDPGNAGTIIRVADAVGADAVIFSGTTIDPFNPKLVRSTTGSFFHLPIATTENLEECTKALRKAKITPIAAHQHGADVTNSLAALTPAHAWILGNEDAGLGVTELKLCDYPLALPIYGHAESLNLASAASALLYLSATAQRNKH